MLTQESTLVLWFQSLTCLQLGNDVQSYVAGNNRTYWRDNPSIGHFRIRKNCMQGKNFEILKIVDVA